MNKYIKLNFVKVLGVPIYVHWSTLLIVGGIMAASIKNPILGIISICSYLGFILLHEAGHAYLAKKFGYHVSAIYLSFIHGRCCYQGTNNVKHDAIIAWGGVVAQLIVAIPLIILDQTTSITEIYGFGPIVAFLGYVSALASLVNLAPSCPLDGAMAWKLIPILYKQRANKKNKKKKHKFRIIK